MHAGLTRTTLQRSHTDDDYDEDVDTSRARGGRRTVSAGWVCRAGLHASLARTSLQQSHTDDEDPRRQCGFVAMLCGSSLHAVQLGQPPPHSLFSGRPGPGVPSSSSSSSMWPRCNVVPVRPACSPAPPPHRTHCFPASPSPARAAVGRSLHSFRCIAFRCLSETGQAHTRPSHGCGRSHMPAPAPPASRIARATRGCHRRPGSHEDESSV